MEQTQTPYSEVLEKKGRKSKFKLYLKVSLLVLILIGVGYLYYTYNSINKTLASVEQLNIENTSLKAEVYDYKMLKESLNDEIEACEDVLTKEEGNFAQFSYCQNFLDFSKSLKLN